MRVFDIYSFNVIDKVKLKDTQKYVEKMLSEFGLSYKNIGFSLENPLCLEAVVEKYPALSKYLVSVGENIYRRQSFLTSFTKNWIDGEIYADEEDYAVIGEIFTKIPRPFNFGSSTLILDGIDWYGGGNLSLATKNDAFYVGKVPTGHLPFMNSSIMLVREINYGNKFNMVYVTVEATGESAPRYE